MIWSFERGDEVLRLETRVDPVTHEYIVVITFTGRPPTIERYAGPAEYRARILALENNLAEQHWSQVGPPTILPEGWKLTSTPSP